MARNTGLFFSSINFRQILCGRKKSLNKTSNYAVYMNKSESDDSFVGKVRSNFLGTEFLFFDNGVNPKQSKVFGDERKVLGGVIYVHL